MSKKENDSLLNKDSPPSISGKKENKIYKIYSYKEYNLIIEYDLT